MRALLAQKESDQLCNFLGPAASLILSTDGEAEDIACIMGVSMGPLENKVSSHQPALRTATW